MIAIVNAKAGSAPEVLEALARHGDFDVREVDGGDCADAVRAAIATGARRILVAGGDGTIASAASVLVETDVELAIVPGGTLNHFARDHGIPEDPEEAVALARAGAATPVNVARVNDRVFLNTSSAGAYVALVRRRDRLERWLGYTLASLVAAVQVFFTLERIAVEVETPDGPRLYRTPLLFVGVGERELKLPSLGKRVPGGERTLHVLVVRGRTRGAILALAFAAAMRGTRALRTPHLDALKVERCTVRLRPRTPVSTDGEVVGLEGPLEYVLLRDALRLVRPPPDSRVS